MTSMIERVAREIAKANGDNFDAALANKSDWNAKRGEGGGRFRDINEPFQSDYLDMARAAIEEMMKPTPEMVKVGETEMMARHTNLDCFQDPYVNSTWEAMITAALKENGE